MSASIKNLTDALKTFRARCFWSVRKEMPLLELPRGTLLHGLRTHGGREGMLLVARF